MVREPNYQPGFSRALSSGRGNGLEKSKDAWEEIKVILQANNELEQHAEQIKNLAQHYGIGLTDSYVKFKDRVQEGDSLSLYMSQVNHPNKNGHQLIADELMHFFK